MADLPALKKFEQGVISAERKFDCTLATDPIYYYDLPFMIDAEHIRLLVAEFNGQLIASGYARIEEAKHYLKHHSHAYLGFMYVEPGHRGRGINYLIIEQLKAWAVSKEIDELRLDVYYENEPAINAYIKSGFSRHMIEMRRDAKNS